jgi:subtilisin family serine protease
MVELIDKQRRSLRLIRLGETAERASHPPRKGPPSVVFRDVASGLLRVVDRELVLRFRASAPEVRRRAILRDQGFVVRRTNPFIPDQVVVFQPEGRSPAEGLIEIANRWVEMEEVVLAAPVFRSEYRRQLAPEVRSEEWHLWDIRAVAAWERTQGDREIVVAVLDDGIDLEHPNLAPNLWRNPEPDSLDRVGRDFTVSPDEPGHFDPRPKRFSHPYDNPMGNDIHGTPCAGLIAAAGLADGSIGVAPRCRILPVKIFRGEALVCDEGVANAIRYAALHADLLSCSWIGGFSPDVSLALQDAGVLGRGGRGAAVFCAAGNGCGAPVGFPASVSDAIAVGASTDLGIWAEYANRGSELSIVAPSSGGARRIFTTDVSLPGYGFDPAGSQTGQFGGTSAATAIAAGVAALVLSVNPDLSRMELKDLLERTADKIGEGYDARGHSEKLGFGRVNAERAVEEAARMAGLSPRPVSSQCGNTEKAYSSRPPSRVGLLRSS